jgi:hypothetical protein
MMFTTVPIHFQLYILSASAGEFLITISAFKYGRNVLMIYPVALRHNARPMNRAFSPRGSRPMTAWTTPWVKRVRLE